MAVIILGIESSCDDTSAAVLRDEFLLSNVMASQEVHRQYGGVIPELASRAHQQNILPVVSQALRQAAVTLDDVNAIAFTRGPGLLGSLLVGTSFTKGLAVATGKQIIEVNHLQGHILSHFVKVEGRDNRCPAFPFLCLLVSGGHTQIVRVDDPLHFEILGHTIDDAVGGPVVDRLASEGDEKRFRFAKPNISGLDYSFSGIKTSILYFLRDQVAVDPDFVEKNKADLCASFQKDLIDILLKKLILATKQTGIRQVAIAGGVSANSGLRNRIAEEGRKRGWTTFLPELRFTTDNAAMIAITGYYKYLAGQFAPLDIAPLSRAAEYGD